MDYTVLVHRAEEGGYWTELPSLPGCFSQGETVEEAIENAKEAARSHLAALREEGLDVADDDGLLIAMVHVAA